MLFKNSKAFALSFLVAASALVQTAIAGDYTVGALSVQQPIARATAPGARVGGGYVIIYNKGSEPDRLLGGQATFASKVEIHEMKIENDVMKMKPIEGGLTIPAGGMVTLAPGGNHIMFMQLKETLKEGAEHKAILTFEKAGNVEVVFQIKSIAETMKLKGAMKKKHDGH